MENNQLPAAQESVFNGLQVAEVLSGASETLIDNKERSRKCYDYGQNLLANVEQTGMNPELDKLMAAFIVKAKKTLDLIYDRRKGVSRIIQRITKEFTGAENAIKDIADKVQAQRNAYAQKLAAEQAERERKALEEQQKAQERIRVEQELTNSMSQAYAALIERTKLADMDTINKATLETIDTLQQQFEQRPYTFNEAMLKIDQLFVASRFYNAQAQAEIKKAIWEAEREHVAATYESEMRVHKVNMVDRCRARKVELEQMAIADGARKAEMERLAAERAQQEAERIQAERVEAERKAKEQAEIEAQRKTLEAEVTTKVELHTERKDKQSVEITVLHTQGYLLLTKQWYDNEGYNVPSDKFERMTFARIKAWAEKYTEKTGDALQSEYIKYNTKVTAK